MVGRSPTPSHAWPWAALLAGNLALALGPWSVRLADSGPVAAGFWRLSLAVPLLFLLARASRQASGTLTRGDWAVMFAAGTVFALDLASWHIGIDHTRLGNATLFGNSGSLILMLWGMVALRRRPRARELAAIAAALAGGAILVGRSFELDSRYIVGDLFSLMAGLFYAAYILLIQGARDRFGGWTLLGWSSLFGAPLLLVVAVLRGEPVWPQSWGPLVVLALGSQVIGQGLLVYALKHFSALIVGVVLLTQPAVAALAGWFAFDETMGLPDMLGMALVGAALVIARLGKPAASPAA